MPTTASRDDWATPLAALVVSIRHLAGGKPWDVPGVRAALHRARHLAPPHQLAHAAIDWAIMRPDLTAPIGLEDDGPWWHTGRTPAARVAEARCTEVGHEHEVARNCRLCAGEAKGDPDVVASPTASPERAERTTRGMELVRAALNPKEHPDE